MYACKCITKTVRVWLSMTLTVLLLQRCCPLNFYIHGLLTAIVQTLMQSQFEVLRLWVVMSVEHHSPWVLEGDNVENNIKIMLSTRISLINSHHHSSPN
jgi:hypothetical protein